MTNPVMLGRIETPDAMDDLAIARLEATVYQFGQSYDSYLVMDLDRSHFWSSGGRAVLAFVVHRKQAVVIGGLIGPDDAREALLLEFMDHCRRHRWTACFTVVFEQDLPMFDRHGFQSTKVGEDARVSLHDCTWQGKAYEWVRRQTSYCQRQGLVTEELTGEADDSNGRMTELAEIATEFLDRTPHGRTMRYFVGQFNPQQLFRRRVFAAIAEGGAGRVEAFTVCTPYRNGAAWAVEMYRARTDAVRGAVPFLIRHVMDTFKAEGAEETSLCMMPAANCEQRRPGDSWLIHTYIRITHRYLSFIFDTPGLYHFKTRFRPRCESRYCSIWPKASVLPFHAMLMAWGTLQFSPWRVAKRGIRMLGLRRQRATLIRS